MGKRKPKAPADSMAELLADAERLAKGELASRPTTEPITALEPLPRDKKTAGAPAKVRIAKQGDQVTIGEAEGGGWAHETFGLDAEHYLFADSLLAQVVASAIGRPNAEMYINGILAMVHAEQPKSPVEAVLLVQTMIAHGIVAQAAERASTAKNATEAARVALQGIRTTAAAVDCLQRVRGKPSSTQRVIVENVTAESGSQVVVGNVGKGGGND